MAADGEAAATVANRYDRGARGGIIMIVALWHLGFALPGLITGWSQYRQPLVAALCWLGYVIVGVVGAARLRRDRPGPVWPLVAALLAMDVAVLAVCPPALVFTPANWAWGAIGWFAIMVLWWRGTRALVGLLAANAAAGLVAVLLAGRTGATDLTRYALVIYGAAALQLAFAVSMPMLRVAAEQTIRAATARSALEAGRSAAEQAQAARRERLQRVRRTAGAALADLADGRADPADPAVRERCGYEAARLRRLIAEADDVPDPLLHELRACADGAERAGMPVDLICVGQLPPLPVAVRRRLAEPMVRPLSTARSPVRITVAASEDEVAVSVVTRDADTGGAVPADLADVSYTCEREEGLLWVQTRWRAP
jgi:hypothetical protein